MDARTSQLTADEAGLRKGVEFARIPRNPRRHEQRNAARRNRVSARIKRKIMAKQSRKINRRK